MKKIIKNYSVSIAVATALGFVFTPVLTWYYSEFIIEKYLLVLTIINFLGLILPLGLDEALLLYFYKENKNNSIVECGLPGLILVITLSPLIFYLLMDKLGLSFIQSGMIIATLFLQHINRFWSLVNRMLFDHVWFPINTVAVKIVPVLVIFISVLLNQNGSINFLLIGLFLTAFLTFAIYTRYLMVDTEIKFNHVEWKSENIIEKIKYGAPIQLAILTNWAILNTDKPFLATYSDSFNVSCLAIIGAATALGMVLQSIFSTIWMPYGMSSAIEDFDGFKQNAVKILKIQKQVSWMLISIAFILSPYMIMFFPEKYRIAYFVLPMTLLPAIIYSSSEVINILFSIKNKQNLLFIFSIIGLLLNLVINFEFASNGFMATVLSIAISYLAVYLIKMIYVRKLISDVIRSEVANISLIFGSCVFYMHFSQENYPIVLTFSMGMIFYQAYKVFQVRLLK